jgi:hypothetical protein
MVSSTPHGNQDKIVSDNYNRIIAIDELTKTLFEKIQSDISAIKKLQKNLGTVKESKSLRSDIREKLKQGSALFFQVKQ